MTYASVIVPVGRVDQGVRVQLEALANQRDAPEYEVLLARNVSGDDAARSLKAMVADIGPVARCDIIIVAADEVRGASFARNVGVRHSRGRVFAFCDADDRVHPDWLDHLIEALRCYDAVGGRLIDTNLDGKSIRRPPATPNDLPTFMGVPYAVGANFAVHRAAFVEAGGFDESLRHCEDIALSWSLLSRGYTLGWAGDAIVDYHHRSGLAAMARQHVAYGRGMAQVLARYGPPSAGAGPRVGISDDPSAAPEPGRARLLRPNSPLRADLSPSGLIRRCSLIVGRTLGAISERARR